MLAGRGIERRGKKKGVCFGTSGKVRKKLGREKGKSVE